MTIQEYQSQLLKLLDDTTENFNSQLPAIEKDIFRRIQLLIKDLDIKDGTVLNNLDNLKKIGKIQAEIESAVLNPKYLEVVQEFVNVFDKIAVLQQKYFKTNFDEKLPEEKLKEFHKQAKEATVKALPEMELRQN